MSLDKSKLIQKFINVTSNAAISCFVHIEIVRVINWLPTKHNYR